MSEPAPLVIGLGELLWDIFPDSRRPGGAPANVAFQAAQLGLDGRVASRVGADPLGEELKQFLATKGLETSLIQSDALHETGQVTVDLSDRHHPRYIIHENAAWDFLEPLPDLLSAARKAAAVCFGTLAQRSQVSRDAIHAVLDTCPDGCLIVYDINLRQKWYDREWIERSIRKASIVKLNREEAEVLGGLLDIDAQDLTYFGRSVCERYGALLTCITRAEDGCLLATASEVVDVPGRAVDVIDAVGAGDAFSAALIASQLWHWPLGRCAEFANTVGGLVASHAGAMPILVDEFASLRKQFAK